MPVTPAPYVRRPYVNEGLVRLADLGAVTARSRANRELYRGALSSRMWSDAGDAIAQGIGAVRQEREMVPLRQAAAAKMAREQELMRRQDEQYEAGQAAQQSAAEKQARLQGLVAEFGGQRVPTDRLLKEFGPEDAAQIESAFDALFPAAPKVGTREIKRRNPDGSEAIEIVEDRPGQSFTSAPPLEKPAAPPNVGSFEDYVVRRFGPQPKPEQIELARKTYQQADDRPIQINNGPKGLTPNMESQVIGRLAKQWTEASKPARDLQRQVKLMEVGLDNARKGNLAAGGQTILVTFQKILDPPSVVRESEYNRSAEGQSLMNRVKGAYERLTMGGPGVTVPELEKFAQLAREAAQAQQGGYLKSVQQRLGLTADRYQIPRELVFEADPDAGADENPEKPGVSGAPKVDAVPNLDGLRPGMGRLLKDGLFKGQTWAVDDAGRPYRVK